MTVTLADTVLEPAVFLAPMAGITDLPFRRLVARFGAGLTVSEMIASREMATARPGAREKAELAAGAAGTAVQIAGCEAHWMAEAARIAEDMGARIVDINMGCPAKRVTSARGAGASGSALMRDLDRALRLIEAVVGAVNVPVTLKMRLGWDDATRNAPLIARRAEAAGVAMIAVHGRTRCQFYTGRADWAAIAALREAVRIPLVANGDIAGPGGAARARALSGADGVMIGRAARGRPWLLAEVARAIFGAPAPVVPHGAALADLVAEHYEAMLGFYGAGLGGRVARKHLGWYMDSAATAAGMRRLVLTAAVPAQVLRLLPEAFGETERAAA